MGSCDGQWDMRRGGDNGMTRHGKSTEIAPPTDPLRPMEKVKEYRLYSGGGAGDAVVMEEGEVHSMVKRGARMVWWLRW